MQISARTPACVAMTAATIDHLSNGRLILGLGVSGPQVVEGWYGQPFPQPLARTREYVSILRKVLAREEPLTMRASTTRCPTRAARGWASPSSSSCIRGERTSPSTWAPRARRTWRLRPRSPTAGFPIFYSPYRHDLYADSLKGMKPDFDIACTVTVNLADDVKAALMPVRMAMSFYIGGMGARDQNFHLNLIKRMGFEEQALRVQDLFLAGKRAEAMAAVPDELCDEISLCGPAGRIKERLEAWTKSPVKTLIAGTRDPAVLRLLADCLL